MSGTTAGLVVAAVLGLGVGATAKGSGATESKIGAARPAIVVELFTSQGCSSCPPADAFLSELGKEADLLPLSFHVDYWDGLGWADPFGSADWTARQREYGRALGSGGRIYTPQIVVAGKEGMVGSHRDVVARALAAARKGTAAKVDFRLSDAARGTIAVAGEVTLAAPSKRRLKLVAALAQTGLVTEVGRGENGGRSLPNDHVVRRLVTLGEIAPGASGVRTAKGTLAIDPKWPRENLRVAVFAQDAETMEIVGGAWRPASELSFGEK